MTKMRAAIFGASGYGGSELLRLLLAHPNANVTMATANEHAGKNVSSVHRNLLGFTDLAFTPAPDDLASVDADVVFLALPHGQAMRIAPELPDDIRVIDLSGDFRISDPEIFKEFYKVESAPPAALQSRFVYGLTETNRDKVREARLISNPGCFATATILALAPLLKQGLMTGRVVVDAKTGSSGSGARAAATTHHPQRANSFYAYRPFTHQHLPEIEEHLRSAVQFDGELIFMTHSLPVTRGIFASCYLETSAALSREDLESLYKEFYADSPFIRWTDGSPDINWVKTTNFCDISGYSNGRNVVVFSAIDNLVKGAAGQAIQNMNLMFGLDERTGLMFPGTNP